MAKHGQLSSQHPHFFRIILPHVLENGTLELPRNFVKEHGKKLHKYARLKVPAGAESKMELKRCNGRAWLHQGWRDFVGKYSIQCGYFLVFRYRGGSRFNVRIFDLSTSEIKYPVTSAATCTKKAGNCQLLIKVKQEEYSDGNNMHKDREMENASKSRRTETPNQMQITNSSTALQRAKAFKCKEPCFTVVMCKSYVEDWYRLVVPRAHSSRHLMHQHGNQAFLHRDDGESWPVSIYVRGPEARFSSGWKDFVVDNNLQVGDACVFQLFRQLPNHYKVTLFRVAE